LHAHPELSGQEFRTAERIEKWLTAIGLRPRRAGRTGVVATLEGKSPGPAVALRADTDALPAAVKPGDPPAAAAAHLCGHDVHTAILLGAAMLLHEARAELPGPVRFLFQPAEETNQGAAALIADGALDGVQAVFGLHNHPALRAGTAAFKPGPLMAAVDRLEIVVQGKGGHAAAPHLCVDPIVAASAIVTGLQTIVSRAVDPQEPVLVTIGRFHAGEAYNVIPDRAVLSGTVRTYSREVRERVSQLIPELVRQIAAGFRATAEVQYLRQAPPTINDAHWTAIARASAEAILGPDQVGVASPTMGGEDFAFYQERVPGCFFWLGSGNPERGITHGWHHPAFAVDEACLPAGAAVMAQIAVDALRAFRSAR
ncbi:MAG: M20 metallopeptidase family protein, partial [Myxococcaceae bacterium]